MDASGTSVNPDTGAYFHGATFADLFTQHQTQAKNKDGHTVNMHLETTNNVLYTGTIYVGNPP